MPLEDLSLLRGEPIKTFALSFRRFPGCASRFVLSERAADRREEDIRLHRLFEKVYGAGLHRPHARGDVGVAGEKDHGDLDVLTLESRLQFEAGGAGQPHVEQQAGRLIRQRLQQELAGRSVRAGLKAALGEQPLKRRAHRLVVVHDVDERGRRHAAAARAVPALMAGNCT